MIEHKRSWNPEIKPSDFSLALLEVIVVLETLMVSFNNFVERLSLVFFIGFHKMAVFFAHLASPRIFLQEISFT